MITTRSATWVRHRLRELHRKCDMSSVCVCVCVYVCVCVCTVHTPHFMFWCVWHELQIKASICMHHTLWYVSLYVHVRVCVCVYVYVCVLCKWQRKERQKSQQEI